MPIKFTVLIPVYNTKPDALIESVYSIINQDDSVKHDLVIIDDASYNPETKTALSFVDRNYPLSLVTFKDNRGTSSALNEGHKFLETKYIAIQGSDDISHPSRLRLQREYLERNPDVDVVGMELFAFKNNDITRKPMFTSHHKPAPKYGDDWAISHGTACYKLSSVLKVGGYDETKRRHQDKDLWDRMLKAGMKLRNIELKKYYYAWRRY